MSHLPKKHPLPTGAPSLQRILQRPDTWRASHHEQNQGNAISSGYRQLDQSLHLGGWPCAALSELYVPDYGIGELSLLLPVMRRWSQQQQLIFLLNPPAIPYPPALRAAGIDPACIRHVRCRKPKQSQWAACEILAAGSAAGLLYWSGKQAPDYQQRRQMQLSAARGRCSAFFFGRQDLTATHSPAALRLSLQADSRYLRLHIHKQRGGSAGQSLQLLRDPRLWQQLSLHALSADSPQPTQGLDQRLQTNSRQQNSGEPTRWH